MNNIHTILPSRCSDKLSFHIKKPSFFYAKIRGLQIAIDDFGTGYSSLSYLNQFPVDRLKIDRSFVIDIADNKDDRILVSLITEMGRKLGLNVIAEGVEDDNQKNLLLGMGCHAMQGYLFGKPLPFEEFCDYVAKSDGA